MRSTRRCLVLAIAGFVACSSEPKEPERVRVQQIVIGFHGSMGNYKKIQRSREDAEKLAADVLQRAKAGEDFDALVKQYTDDKPPGILQLWNEGSLPPEGFLPRRILPEALGDLAFQMAVGDIGMASYDPKRSPMGWHILRRLE